MIKKQKIIVDKTKRLDYSHSKHSFLVGVVCLLVLFSLNFTSAFDWSDEVVNYYKLDETSGTVIDSTGLNNGTNYGSLPNQEGKINKSYLFDGVGDSVNLSSNQVITTSPMTISAWVYPMFNTATDDRYIYGWGETTALKGISFGSNAGNLAVTDFSTASFTGIKYDNNSWQFVVLRYNGTGYTIDKFNTTNQYTAYSGGGITLNITAAKPEIGSFGVVNPGDRYYWKGKIDELGVWNRSLTDAEVLELYNSGDGLTYSISGFTTNSIIYNSSLYETETIEDMRFFLNITNNGLNYDTVNSTFVYNGVSYSVNQTTNGDTFTFESFLDTTMDSSNRTFYWYINGTNSTGSYFTNYSYTQISNPVIFTICNSTYNTKFLNISFKDETSEEGINASIPSSTWVYYLGDGSVTKTYLYSNSTENYNYTFCVTPINRTIHVDPYVQYKQGTDYPQRIWDASVQDYTNSTTNKILYLLSSVDGIYVTFQVINSADQVISGVDVQAVREIDGEDVIVAQGTTGASGTVTFWLNPDFSHTFSFSKTGYTPYSYSDTPTQTSYTITLGGGTTGTNSTFQGIDYSIIPTNTYLVNNTDYTFGFNLTSSYWDVEEYGFNLRLPNGTIISGGSTGTEGTELTLSYNTGNLTIIYIDYYWVINGNYTNATRYWPIQNSEYTDWSIKTFFTDLNTYLDSGLFGIDNFGRYLIIFIVLFFTAGIMSYKFGLTSPLSVSTIIFATIFFFDIVVGLIPDIRGIEHLLTYLSGLVLVVLIFREVQT